MTVGALKSRLLIGDAGVALLDLGRQNVLPLIVFLCGMTCLARQDGYVGVLHRSDVVILSDP